jgi:hypothetical protein
MARKAGKPTEEKPAVKPAEEKKQPKSSRKPSVKPAEEKKQAKTSRKPSAKPSGKQTEKPAEEKKPAAARKPAKKAPEPVTRERRELTSAQWRKIRLEYVKGNTTYRELSEKYHVSIDTIGKHASKEGWRRRRKKLDEKVEEKTLLRVCDARAREFEKLAEINDNMSVALDSLVNFLVKNPEFMLKDLKGVEGISKAIAQIVQTKRDLYNLPNETEKAKIEGIREKIRLEREKFQEEQAEKAASKQAAEDTVFRIVVEGETEALDE